MAKSKSRNRYDEYPDDIFKDTRMSFGDHIEELRHRMVAALKWLLFFLIIGFVLDAVGEAAKNPNIGVGKPMLKVITDPVEEQVRDFYNRRIEKFAVDKFAVPADTDPEEVRRVEAKLKAAGNNLSELTPSERATLRSAPQPLDMVVDVAELRKVLGLPEAPGGQKEARITVQVIPAKVTVMTERGQGLLEAKQHLSTLSVQEGFVVYFKVSLLCGFVLASPFILYQFWAFVGAGLYPHEKKYVYSLFGPSLFLFLGGIVLCQFLVLPGAVKALLAFNEWLGFDPDIRLREWLGLAIILPLVFGISFQTPLVMVFLNRIGMFTAADYLARWRGAIMVIAVFAALITPTPDIVTMMYLFVPMFGLYLAGVAVCHFFPGTLDEDEEAEAGQEVAV
ncbi:MAG: twin-arginine translocase subunit TatC [Isosphaera sp.]|nr:twin-arginine translocase subunit TatC [Isosphaera sp.]